MMKKIYLWSFLSVIFISLAVWVFFPRPVQLPSKTVPVFIPPKKLIQFNSYTLPNRIVYVLRIPNARQFLITTAVSQTVDSLETFAQTYPGKLLPKKKAIAVINGGFFDPNNQQSNSFVIHQGNIIADPQLNQDMMTNPNLTPYLTKILNRTEFRRYLCGETIRYDIVPHQEQVPTACRLIDAIGGGPSLLPQLTLQEEGFFDLNHGQILRDPLGNNQPNARTAIGIDDQNNLVWVMVGQKSSVTASSGITLTELGNLMTTMGVKKAMNLDGGSSSSLYYQGKTFYGKIDENGNPIGRSVKSVIICLDNES